MVELGYALSSEEFSPRDLVKQAQRAEETGFAFALISDHFHPWLDSQGHSPFVWTTLGAIAQTTTKLKVGTGVTCPLMRYHPAIVAQAAATVASLFEGRFFLGLGSGEALNEHIVGQHWPPVSVRHEMLREAVGLIRKLWQGDYVTEHGRFYTVEEAKLYTLPETSPEIAIAASGEEAAKLAGELGDALVSTAPDAKTVQAFQASGPGGDRPRYGQMTICWGPDEQKAKELALKMWGYTALPGQISQELDIPTFFEQATSVVTTDQIAKSIVSGPDPEPVRQQIRAFADAGYSHVYLHQVGPDQEGFFKFAEKELLSAFAPVHA
jgi:G6PDH family F420-dependent oxidoreductase